MNRIVDILLDKGNLKLLTAQNLTAN